MVQVQQFKLRRFGYYVSSFIALLRKITVPHVPLLLKKKVVLSDSGLSFEVHNLLDLLILKETVIDGVYTPSGTLRKNAVIVDIGGGFGDFSIVSAKKYADSSIFVFEPDILYQELLRKNCTNNGLRNITIFRTAVFSLKDIFLKIKERHIDFLKIDCEGCEFSIFTPESVQQLHEVDEIVLEYHEFGGKKITTLVSILKKAGFAIAVSPQEDVPGIGYLRAIQRGITP